MTEQTGPATMNMNDRQWMAKLSAVAASDMSAAASVPVPQHMPQVSMAFDVPAPNVQLDPAQSLVAGGVVAMNAQARMYPPEAAPTVHRARRRLSMEMPKLGMVDQFMQDEAVSDILINGVHSIYIDKDGIMVDSGIRFRTHEEVWEIADRIMKTAGQSLSMERPMVDTRLPDGSRVNIIAPPMSVDGVVISIRKFPASRVTLKGMVEREHLTPELAEFLSACVRHRLNIVVCGGTGSGKTTMLNVLSSSVSHGERIVTVEDSAELRLQQPHVVRLESKVATEANAHQEVSIRDLVRNSLRMRPDRIIVGEVRDGAAFDMLQAMNTGHDGSMTTVHANTPRDALTRLETLVSMAMPQLPVRMVRGAIASSVNLVINMTRFKDGVRRMTHISEISGMEGDLILMQDLILYSDTVSGKDGIYRWATGSPRIPLVTELARETGLMRGLR